MEELPEDTRKELIKMSSERIRLRLVQAGYNEEQLFTLSRDDLLEALALHILYPPAETKEVLKGAEGGMERTEELSKAEERELRMMELREMELRDREEERQIRREQLQLERQRKEREKLKEERELVKEERLAKELERQMKKNEEDRAQKESVPGQLRYFGKMLDPLLPKLGEDPTEYPAYFESVEDKFRTIQVPKNIQAKLILPKLNDRSRSLLTKMPKEHLDDYNQMKSYLLRKFKLTAEQYRDSFWSATKRPEETLVIWCSRQNSVPILLK